MHSADVKTFFIFWFSPIFNGKTGLCESEDLFFWSSSIFSGKTGLCGREDLYFVGLQRLFVVSQRKAFDVLVI